MELRKLSVNVNKKTNASIQKLFLGLCVLAGMVILAIILGNATKNNRKQVELFRAEIDKSMSEKIAFIDTVAAGVSSGTVTGNIGAYVDQMAGLHSDVSAVYVCVEEAGTIYSDGIMTYMSGGWIPSADFVVSERSWYTGAVACDSVFVSEPYVDEQSGNICITLAKAIVRDGRTIGVAGMDMYMDDLVSLIESSYDGGNYIFLVSGEGTILTHPDSSVALTVGSSSHIQDAYHGKYEKVYGKEGKNRLIWDYKGGFKFAVSDSSETTGWKVVAVISLKGVLLAALLIIVVAVAAGIGIGKLIGHHVTKSVSPMFAPLEALSANVSKISEGKLDYTFTVDEQSEEVHALTIALNDTMRSLQHYISEIANAVTAISEKNLNFSVDGDYAGDYESIKLALLRIMEVLNDSFREINTQAGTVLEYSGELSKTSECVARIATDQSESVIHASEEMKHLTDNMEQIAGLADTIKHNTDTTNENLSVGNQEMQELVDAMNEIAGCYDEIAGFVTEINAIASQTNLLALNASIEAARAGEAGRGFAVVADEIGILSNGSAQSSAKISSVIARSLSSVEKGKNLVKKTQKTIQDGVAYSEESTQMVNAIVNSVNVQKQSVNEISANLKEISSMAESNAASAQENSAISMNLGDCAAALMDTIREFNLKK